jgi:hypothetical protein
VHQAALYSLRPQIRFLAITQPDQGGLIDQPRPLCHDHASIGPTRSRYLDKIRRYPAIAALIDAA